MPSDIPNYIALPVGVILSVACSLLLMRHQDEISGFFSRSREQSTLKKRDKALAEYNLLKRMRAEPEFSMLTIAKLTNDCATGRFLTTVASTPVLLGGLAIIKTMFDTPTSQPTDTSALLFYFTFIPIKWLVAGAAILLTIAITTTTSRVIHLRATIETLLNFDAFEAKVKAAWPDIFPGHEKTREPKA